MAWWFLFCSCKHFLFCWEALRESSRLALKKRNWKTTYKLTLWPGAPWRQVVKLRFNIPQRPKGSWLQVAAVSIRQVLPGLAPSTPAPILRPLRVEIETLKAEVCMMGFTIMSLLPQTFCNFFGGGWLMTVDEHRSFSWTKVGWWITARHRNVMGRPDFWPWRCEVRFVFCGVGRRWKHWQFWVIPSSGVMKRTIFGTCSNHFVLNYSKS